MSDEFTTYDAAYLVGALSPQERNEYERHLRQCPECSGAVSRLAGMPGLLSRLSRAEAEAILGDEAGRPPSPAVPDTLLSRLLKEVEKQRIRRRWGTTLLAAAAAVVVTLALVFGLGHGAGGNAAPTPLALSAVRAGLPLHATAQLEDRSWGTHITLRCEYDGQVYSPGDYTLVVTDKTGRAQQIATWSVVPGKVATVDGSTALAPKDISTVQVRTAKNKPVLMLKL
jgi:Putative zinc-finger